MTAVRWPLGPLQELLDGRLGPALRAVARADGTYELAGTTAANIEALLGLAPSSWPRILAHGTLSTRMADRAAIALGLHPALIWTDWYDRDIDVAS